MIAVHVLGAWRVRLADYRRIMLLLVLSLAANVTMFVGACTQRAAPVAPVVSSGTALEIPSADTRAAAAIVGQPTPAAKPAKTAQTIRKPVKARHDQLTRGECNGELARQLRDAVDTKIDFDIQYHKIRDFGSVLAAPSVTHFREVCASLPA